MRRYPAGLILQSVKDPLIVLILLAAIPARAAESKKVYLPPVPAFVEVSTKGAQGNAFCTSPELREYLDQNFFHFTSAHESLHPDLVLNCTADDKRVRITVDAADGARVSAVQTKIDPQDFKATAFVAVRKLATDKKTIDAALAAYDNNLRFVHLKPGAEAFDAQDWPTVVKHFPPVLETSAPPAVVYFGLYAAHAKLGHDRLATWYLKAFCEAGGKDPSKLTEQQLAYLKELRSKPAVAPQPFDQANLTEELLLRKWSWAVSDLKVKLAVEPWDAKSYVLIADVYAKVGWASLVDNWRKRGALARKIEADDALSRGIEKLAPKR